MVYACYRHRDRMVAAFSSPAHYSQSHIPSKTFELFVSFVVDKLGNDLHCFAAVLPGFCGADTADIQQVDMFNRFMCRQCFERAVGIYPVGRYTILNSFCPSPLTQGIKQDQVRINVVIWFCRLCTSFLFAFLFH